MTQINTNQKFSAYPSSLFPPCFLFKYFVSHIPVENVNVENLNITINKEGSPYYSKGSYPLRFGCFTEIRNQEYVFIFNLNHEIKIIQGLGRDWPDPNEWLKRNAAGDWIYYSSAGYKGVHSFIGEYYLPCFSYSDNPIFNIYTYDKDVINKALAAFDDLMDMLNKSPRYKLSDNVMSTVESIVQNNSRCNKEKADTFYAITSGPATVLPPDSRHVDYDVIPVNVADGCLYNCGFCSIKTGNRFKPRDKENILDQIKALKQFYGYDIKNYNSVFLGQHDALNAGSEIITYAARTAYDTFNFETSFMKKPMLFLFGSVDSLLKAKEILFENLNNLPFYTYINIGLESAHEETLKMLKKPVTVQRVEKAFDRMLEINRCYSNVEITANFVMGQDLPDDHYDSISRLTKTRLDHFYSKGSFYLSPLENGGTTREVQKKFTAMKNACLVPTYIYLIQRL